MLLEFEIPDFASLELLMRGWKLNKISEVNT
jgi:hypothetical protein